MAAAKALDARPYRPELRSHGIECSRARIDDNSANSHPAVEEPACRRADDRAGRLAPKWSRQSEMDVAYNERIAASLGPRRFASSRNDRSSEFPSGDLIDAMAKSQMIFEFHTLKRRASSSGIITWTNGGFVSVRLASLIQSMYELTGC